MKENNRLFRPLKANEIEARVASKASDKGIMLLLYKDARVDMKLLDETFGAFGWKKSYHSIDGRLYCTISIKNPETGEWIDKTDVGTESQTEKEKGQASDAFKRAGFNWGIGRELYTTPFIFIKKGCYTENDKQSTYDTFKVTDIGYDDDGNINKLVIYNEKTHKKVYTYNSTETVSVEETIEPVDDPVEETVKKAYPSRDQMLSLAKIHYPDGSKALNDLLDTFKAKSLDECTDKQLMAIYNKYGV